MKVQELLERLNILAPFSSALEWDNVGLLLGYTGADVKKIYVALDISDEVIANAARNKCDLIISHHPMIFKPINKVVSDDVTGSRIIEMIACGMNYIAMHTNFDVHVMGRIVSERIGFNRFSVLDETETGGRVPLGIGTVCELQEPIELAVLASHVRESFPLPFTTFFGDEDAIIKRAAVVPGSGKSEIKAAIEAKADVLITGDISHHEGIDAVAAGLNIIDAGHYGLEHIFVEYMEKYIRESMPGIEVVAEKKVFPRRLA